MNTEKFSLENSNYDAGPNKKEGREQCPDCGEPTEKGKGEFFFEEEKNKEGEIIEIKGHKSYMHKCTKCGLKYVLNKIKI